MLSGRANPDVPRVTDSLPAVCEVRNFLIFGPGYHKGSLYTPEMCSRVPVNFARLSGLLQPVVKLGHDRQQRLAKSLGFPNLGTVTAVTPRPDVGRGYFAVSARNIPTAVGAEINAGRLNSGSVELVPRLADPDDPATEIDGPILTGFAFLGEEQPAVKGFAPPRAVFADGSPVPASTNPAPWLVAMAAVAVMSAATAPSEHAAQFAWLGREYSADVISFSEMQPMDLKAKLEAAGLSPDEIQKCLAACGQMSAAPAAPAGAAPATPSAPAAAPMGDLTIQHDDDKDQAALAAYGKYADDPVATPEQKLMATMARSFAAMSKKFSADLDDIKKRTGAVEKMAEDAQKKDDEVQMAAFADKVSVAVRQIERKLPPAQIEKVVKPHALAILTTKSYAAETDRLAAFNDYFSGLASLPDDPRLSRPLSASAAGAHVEPRVTTPQGQSVLKHLVVTNPRSVQRLSADGAT